MSLVNQAESAAPSAAYRRQLHPQDIALPDGFAIEVFAERLNVPINILFTDQGELLVADAGVDR